MAINIVALQSWRNPACIFLTVLISLGLAAQTPARAPSNPEQERLNLIQALQKRLPGTNPADWVIGGTAFEAGVQAIPLSADNATNSADILAIGKKLWG